MDPGMVLVMNLGHILEQNLRWDLGQKLELDLSCDIWFRTWDGILV